MVIEPPLFGSFQGGRRLVRSCCRCLVALYCLSVSMAAALLRVGLAWLDSTWLGRSAWRGVGWLERNRQIYLLACSSSIHIALSRAPGASDSVVPLSLAAVAVSLTAVTVSLTLVTVSLTAGIAAAA